MHIQSCVFLVSSILKRYYTHKRALCQHLITVCLNKLLVFKHELYTNTTRLSRFIFGRYAQIVVDIEPLFVYNTPMKKYKKKPWTEAERNTLKAYYFNASIDEVMDMIPDRTERSIRNQVSYLRKRGVRFK